MSRFFKSAAFPILIVVVLAFFASKLVSDSSNTPTFSFGDLVQQIEHKRRQQRLARPEEQQRRGRADERHQVLDRLPEQLRLDADQQT